VPPPVLGALRPASQEEREIRNGASPHESRRPEGHDGGGAHWPVLLAESLIGLAVRPGGRYVDATVGLGGHAEAILEASAPDGRLIAVDRDPTSLAAARDRLARFGDRVTFVAGNYDRFDERAGLTPGLIDGIVADLGVSSPQLDRGERGFSLMRTGPLDMRMDPTRGPTAREFLMGASQDELESCLKAAGEARFARKLARRLLEAAPDLTTTDQLAAAVCRWVPRRGKTHPATRVFLALRMAVNQELESLTEFLHRAGGVLKPGGRLAVISFHSGEDRLVKWFGRGEAAAGRLRIITKKPLEASEEEQRLNPRSRSAKLRVFEKI
jgi:16S rRNA (cytosine1402-N4)-methyltransferase